METKKYKNYITWKNNKGEFNTECNRASLPNGIALTIPTQNQTKVATGGGLYKMRIRKLTPKECLILMGFERKDEQALREIGMSDSAIYHVAGDSIITTCLMAVLGQLVYSEKELKEIIENYVERIVNV